MNSAINGRVKVEHYESTIEGASDFTIYTDPNDCMPELWVASTQSDKPGDKANADLIVAAWNACVEINPENPIAAAEAMPSLAQAVEAALVLMEDETIDEDEAINSACKILRSAFLKIKATG